MHIFGKTKKPSCNPRVKHLQTLSDARAWRDRFRLNPWAKVGSLFVPLPLRMSPGYPCCCCNPCNEECPCTPFLPADAPGPPWEMIIPSPGIVIPDAIVHCLCSENMTVEGTFILDSTSGASRFYKGEPTYDCSGTEFFTTIFIQFSFFEGNQKCFKTIFRIGISDTPLTVGCNVPLSTEQSPYSGCAAFPTFYSNAATGVTCEKI